MLARRRTLQLAPRGLPPETLARITALTAERQAYMQDIQQQRDYDAGRQFIRLTDRLRSFLGGLGLPSEDDWKRVRLNIFHTVINAVVERMVIAKLTTDEVGSTAPLVDELGQVVRGADGLPVPGTVKPVAEWAGRTWLHNRMDARQRRIFAMALRDSEAFVLVSWDDEKKIARFVQHQRFVDSTVGGDGYGCTAVYANDDPEQQLLFVTKRWTEVLYENGAPFHRQRLTLYYPDRIEKYAGLQDVWEPTQDAGDTAWPLPWVDPNTGEPLGIPVVHFRSTAGFEAVEAIGPQNAINKTMIDLLAAGDMTAFRILIAFGWKPVDADGNPLPLDPGTWQGTENPNGSVTAVPGADLSTISDQVYNWIQWAAMATDTPVARFTSSRNTPSEGNQKQSDGPLLHKIRMRQNELAIGIADMFVVARRMHNAFFGAPKLDIEAEIGVEWESIISRDEDAEIARADIKINKLQIPPEQVWSELGYSEVQIAQWLAKAEQRKLEAQQRQQDQLAMMQAKASAGGAQDQQQQPPPMPPQQQQQQGGA